MYRSTPITVTDSAPNTDNPKSDRVSAALLVFPAAAAMLLLQSAAAVSTASSSAAAAIGLDYFSAGDSVSSSVFDYPPSLLHSVDRVLEELAKQHLDDLSLSVNMIDSAAQLKPFSFSEMPSPRRVADPTGVYGQQDAAEGDVHIGSRKHSFSNVSSWNPVTDATHFRSSPNKRSASSRTPHAPPLLFRHQANPCPAVASSSSSTSSPSSIISGAKAVDYASFAAAVVTLIININNNVNNRNNNNNNFNLNAVSSSNVQSNSNTNIANQGSIQ